MSFESLYTVICSIIAYIPLSILKQIRYKQYKTLIISVIYSKIQSLNNCLSREKMITNVVLVLVTDVSIFELLTVRKCCYQG